MDVHERWCVDVIGLGLATLALPPTNVVGWIGWAVVVLYVLTPALTAGPEETPDDRYCG